MQLVKLRLGTATVMAVLLSICLPLSVLAHSESQADTDVDAPVDAQAAQAFIQDAEDTLARLALEAAQAAWVYANFITFDTEQIQARANEKYTAEVVRLANEAARFNDLELDSVTRRKLDLLRANLTLPAPQDADKNAELASIAAKLEGMYGKGEYCRTEDDCMDLTALSNTLAESRDYDELLDVWNGWRTVSPPMRPLYTRQVELANEGAQELGFANLADMWRSKYDMQPQAFSAELDRLWGQVEPLYEQLHCYVRAELAEEYGDELVPGDGPIPAHLLGNMWAQQWGNIYPLVERDNAGESVDITALLEANDYDALKMVKTGEGFFSSLGLEPLPETFYVRSLFTKPEDRDVVCHASAWDIDSQDDIRIKMCIQVNGEDFNTIHHELGHNYYQRAYSIQPPLFRGSANDGFHEALGDAVALSITPDYLQQIGLLDEVPEAGDDVDQLLRQALDKIAFLPFGLMVDQWRWKVFSGEVGPEGYNDLWWQLREKYQGVAAPNERPADAFDPGAKYHVPGNTPYSRYFLAHILQFQFHKALCDIAGQEGPVHRCSIYGSEEAGQRLNAMMEMGLSKPWPDALEALTGKRDMDATAILDYFRPLQGWLETRNEGRQCGW